MWMLFIVSWWLVTVSSLRSHSWKQTITLRPRIQAAKRGGHFGVLDQCSVPTQLFTASGSATSDGITPQQPMLVEVYSTLGCKYCKKAKATLEELGVSYLTIDITPESGNADQMVVECEKDGPETKQKKAVRRRRIAHARSTTVPQIYVLPTASSSLTSVDAVDGDDAGARVGGCDDLLKEIESGVFQARLGMKTMGVKKGKVPAAATATTVLASPITSSTTITISNFTPQPYLNHHLSLTLTEGQALALGSQHFDALTLSKALQTQVPDIENITNRTNRTPMFVSVWCFTLYPFWPDPD